MEKKQREREAEEQEQQKQPEVIEVDDEYDEEDRAAFAEASYKKAIQLQTQEAYDAAGLMGIDVSEMEESEVVEMMSSRYMTRSKTTPKKVSRIPFTELDPKELHQRDVEEEERKGKGPGKGKGKGKSSKKIQETEKKKEREEEDVKDVKPNIKIVEDTPVTVMPEIVGDTMLITQTDRFKLRTRPRKTYEELVEEIHRDEADRDPLVYEIESAQEIKVHTPMKTEKDDKKKKDDLGQSIAIVKPPEVVFENIKKFRAFTSDESTQEITTQESSDDKSKDTITTVESTEDDEEDRRQREQEEFRVARINFRESARQYDQWEKLTKGVKDKEGTGRTTEERKVRPQIYGKNVRKAAQETGDT